MTYFPTFCGRYQLKFFTKKYDLQAKCHSSNKILEQVYSKRILIAITCRAKSPHMNHFLLKSFIEYFRMLECSF